MTAKGGKGSLLQGRTHTEVFGILEKGSRKEVKSVLEEKEVSLGMIDPTSGRSLLYKTLSNITNGDKLVLEKLDSCVSTTSEDPDDEDWAVTVSHRYLVKNCQNKNLKQVPRLNLSKLKFKTGSSWTRTREA